MNQEISKIESEEEELKKDENRLKKEEIKIEKDVTKETAESRKRRKRDYVPNADEAYYWKLATERLPPVVTRGAATVDAFKSSAPWVLIQDFDAKNFDHAPHQDEGVPAEKRTLDEGWFFIKCL